jgi:hypothetical protein
MVSHGAEHRANLPLPVNLNIQLAKETPVNKRRSLALTVRGIQLHDISNTDLHLLHISNSFPDT